MTEEIRLTEYSHGAGCACKLGPDELAQVMRHVRQAQSADVEVIVGPETSDDAGVVRLPGGQIILQTVDFFTPVVDDAGDWGRIAAANALSDVYAMGGRPLTALQLIGWPRDQLPFELLGEVIEGGQEILDEAGCVIVGGHSIDDPEPKYGFAITGTVSEDRLLTNSGARPGDALVLTKPLGTGIISTAIKGGEASHEVGRAAVEVMVGLNAAAVEAASDFDVHAATDITGFGLLGHLGEVLRASGTSALIEADAVPVIEGVRELAAAGVYPGGSRRNLKSIARYTEFGDHDQTTIRILCDAQTSGGLLLAVAPADAEDLVGAVADVQPSPVAAIGRLGEGDPRIEIV